MLYGDTDTLLIMETIRPLYRGWVVYTTPPVRGANRSLRVILPMLPNIYFIITGASHRPRRFCMKHIVRLDLLPIQKQTSCYPGWTSCISSISSPRIMIDANQLNPKDNMNHGIILIRCNTSNTTASKCSADWSSIPHHIHRQALKSNPCSTTSWSWKLSSKHLHEVCTNRYCKHPSHFYILINSFQSLLRNQALLGLHSSTGYQHISAV